MSLYLSISYSSYSQVDSIWTPKRDTVKIKQKPVILQEKVLVYVPVPKKKRVPLPKDNHLYLNVILNNQIDYSWYYDSQPKTQVYVDKMNSTTKHGLLGIGYGMGIGYYTNSYVISVEGIVYKFKEKRKILNSEEYYSKPNSYIYFGARISAGLRIGQRKIMVFPKLEFGVNLFDRTDGQTISPLHPDTLDHAQLGYVNYNTKFAWSVWTGGPAIRVAYKLDNFVLYTEPYYNHDFANSIKSSEPFKMKRVYFGCRLGLMFYFF